MYKKIKNKEGVGGLDISKKYLSHTLTTKEFRSKLMVENWDGKTIFTSHEERVNRVCLFDNFIAYVPRIEAITKVVNLSTLEINEIGIVLNNLFTGNPHFYDGVYYNLSEVVGNNTIYDLKTGDIVRIVDKEIAGFIVLNTLDFLVTKKDSYIYTYSKSDFSLMWQQDFSKIAEYQEIDKEQVLGEIREVYSYEDTIIVLTQLFIFKMDIQTGKILCLQKLPAGFMKLSICKNMAYSCYGYHSIQMDLDTLEIANFHRIQYEDHEGKPHFAIMNHPVYHDGLVFHAVRLEGGLHCVGSIDPKTGKRVWICPIGVYDINSIAFHDNRMFVHDTGSTLYILEKVSEENNKYLKNNHL